MAMDETSGKEWHPGLDRNSLPLGTDPYYFDDVE
jgi:hypothetical protein